LALEIFSVTQRWPRREVYGVSAQARRAALSVPTNIAEGAARSGRKEFARFLNIALGSLAELNYLLQFARDFGICEPADWERLEASCDQTGKLLWGLYRRVRLPV
jgi:four helix bundle protein